MGEVGERTRTAGEKRKSVVGKKDVKERGRKEVGHGEGGKVASRKGSWHSHIQPPSRTQELAIGGGSIS